MSADKGRSQTKAGQSATVSGSVSDLRKLAEERRGGRPNTGKAASATAGEENIPEDDLGSLQEVFRIRTGDAKTAEHKRGGAARRTPQKQSLNNLERPASRAEISALESELEDRIRLVLFEFEQPEEKSNGLYSASKENLRLTRDRMLIELGADVSALELEPWLESFIKCECLKTMCDEVSSKLSDMLSVSSTEFGNVLRKLRMNYKQTFEQMRQSWMKMKQALEHTRLQLKNAEKNSEQLQFQLSNKDNQVQSEFEAEIQRMNEDFKIERAREREKLRQTEFKMDQMSDTLKYLNEIFKTMQADASTAKTADLLSKCQRLEKENKELLEQNAEFDVVKAKLAAAEKAVKDLEANKKIQTEENSRLKLQLIRREEVVTELMEKEALRNAEIEKLQKISKLKDDELVAVDLKDAATSVLCIKCKKSLDDLSNIKSAVMGDAKGNKVAMKLQCEYYRILLPNLRGRRPNRTVSWFRSTLRCILISKMREDVALHAIKGETCRFPAFTYSWFTRDVQAMTESGTVAGGGSQVAKALHMADEDRWGLYYCLKAMSKEDPEAMVFWTLLDETHGEDGVRFILHCLSIILSLAGPSLWKQFGPSFVRCSSINARRSGDDSQENVRPNIWLDIDTAKEAVRCILVRALANSVNDAMDAIDALKVRPSLEDLASLEEFGARSVDIFDVEEAGKPIENSVADAASVESATEISQKSNKENETNINSVDLNKLQSENPTHINLFMWLRLMMQQMHADQIHRGAAIRLMFETASVGALIPQPIIGEVEKGTPFGATGSYVEYPQFQSICQTLFPHLSVAETATLFARCYDAGNHRVTSEVFLKTANWQQLFSQAMRLPILPVLRQHVDQTRGDSKGYSLQTVYLIKNKLTTTIHRKLAAISPSVKVLLNQLPERWRTLLTDAVSQTEVALKDANNAKHYSNLATSKIAASMQTGEEVENGEDAEATITVRYLHGLQPYICYRRLITLATFLKSMCDNPLLPTEVFTLSDLEKNDHHSIHLALTTAEKTLTSLEQGIVVASTSKSLEQMLKSKNSTTALHTYDNFDRVRKNLVARRLQSVVRKFLNADVPVPKAVRLCMPIGYLANSKKKSDKSMSSLKSREIVMEPWWGQSCVAEIFAFKLSYDKKAKALGLPLLSLAQATVSYFYFIYGCLPVAERSVQDLFVAVKTYRLGVPRLKLFAAFVGDSRDLDEGVTEILKAPHAVELYLQLLVEIHKSIATTGARKTEKSAKISELSAMGVVVVNEASSFNMNKGKTLLVLSLKIITSFFPIYLYLRSKLVELTRLL